MNWLREKRRRATDERQRCTDANEKASRGRADIEFVLVDGRRVIRTVRARYYHNDVDINSGGAWWPARQEAMVEIPALCVRGFLDGDTFIAPAAILSGRVVREYEEPR